MKIPKRIEHTTNNFRKLKNFKKFKGILCPCPFILSGFFVGSAGVLSRYKLGNCTTLTTSTWFQGRPPRKKQLAAVAGPKADPAPSAGQAGSSAGPAKPATGQPAAASTSSHQTSAIGGSPAIPQTGGSVLGGGGPRQTGGEADPAEIRRRRLGKHGRQFLSFWLVYIYLIRFTLQQLRKVNNFSGRQNLCSSGSL
jgi:hypothetical protein